MKCILPGLLGLLLLDNAHAVQPEAAPGSSQPWFESGHCTGDWFGIRDPFLAETGLEFSAHYTAEVWGNPVGGQKQGTVYTGALDFGAQLDLEKAIGWKGATVSTTWLWLSGRDASEDLVGNFLTISNIAGFNTLRMLELWFEQNLWDDRVSIRAGQLAADAEFITSTYSALFLNGTFGWPALAYMNLPEGGPGFPMGTPGVRVAIRPTEDITFLAAAFQGDVFAQDVNRHGFRYRLNAVTGYTFLAEGQARWNHADTSAGLPGELKFGGWVQSGRYADVLSESTASGNYGFYAVLDQMLFREQASAAPAPEGKSVKNFKEPPEQSDQGLGFFSRVGFAPTDRNFVSFYFDTGLTYKGFIPGRDDDSLGVAFGFAGVSSGGRVSIADEDLSPTSAEMVLEVTYQVQVTSFLTVQPDLQWIVNPGATSSISDALVIGARASVCF